MADGENSIQGAIVSLLIDGESLPTAMVAALNSVTLDQKLNLPAACSAIITPLDNDPQSSKAMDFGTFELGSTMTVAMGFGTPVSMFSGKIAALEPEGSPNGHRIELTGYDALFDLDFGTTIKAFYNATDGEIAAQVIEAGGFVADTGLTETRYAYVLQNNVSNYRMLLSRAALLNFEVSAFDRTVSFQPPRLNDPAVARLEYGTSLTNFRIRVRALKRGSQVTRIGWDPKQKVAIRVTVDSGPASDRMGGEDTGYGASANFPSSAITGPNGGIQDAQSATALAQGAYDSNLDRFIEGRGECYGIPAITPGAKVEITNVGDRFDGPYYVTAAQHLYDIRTGYKTRFEVRRTGI